MITGERLPNTSVIFGTDGNIYEGTESSIRTNRPTPETHRLLATVTKSPQVIQGSMTKHPDLMGAQRLNATMAKTMSHVVQGAADSGFANSINLTHLQLVRLFPEIQGKPIEYFFAEQMFMPRDIPMLEFREPFYDTVQTAQYLNRMEPSGITGTKYDEIYYDLPKLVDKVYTPIEDIMRTIINPKTIDFNQIIWGMKRKRNLRAIEVLKEIGNTQSTNISEFENIAAGAYHSTGHAAKEIVSQFASFLKANDVPINRVAMGLQTFLEYGENTWTNPGGPNGLTYERTQMGGVFPMPGIPGVTCVVDVNLPENKLYCINYEFGLRLGEGPKIMRNYYDEERDSEAIKILDFHQHISVNQQLTKLNRKFGMILNVTP